MSGPHPTLVHVFHPLFLLFFEGLKKRNKRNVAFPKGRKEPLPPLLLSSSKKILFFENIYVHTQKGEKGRFIYFIFSS